jgi:CubicO group peptidase (beta-lactamase class C family)
MMTDASWPSGAFDGVVGLVTEYLDQQVAYGVAIEVAHMSGARFTYTRWDPALGYGLRPDSAFRWFCAVKALLAYTILRSLHDHGLAPDTPVHNVLPDFRGDGREEVSFRHLLTHTSGLPSFPIRGAYASLEDAALATPVLPGHTPGERMAYNICTAWTLVAAAIEKLSGVSVADAMARSVFSPLALQDSVLATRSSSNDRLASRVVHLVNQEAEQDRFAALTSPAVLTRLPAWLGGLGTLRDLVSFFSYLLAVHSGDGSPGERAAVTALTTKSIHGYDATLGRSVTYGHGITTDISTAGFGRGWSEESFGVGGSVDNRIVIAAWADPRRGVACGVALPAVTRLNGVQLDTIGMRLCADLDLSGATGNGWTNER